jgi:hypothetical protein
MNSLLHVMRKLSAQAERELQTPAGLRKIIRRKIMRVEWSPSRNGFYEVLQCGHLGRRRGTYDWPQRTTRQGGRVLVKFRDCKECSEVK